MILFLDIDGVMRRRGSPPRRFDADCLVSFERAVAALPPPCEIVITSSWRENVPLADIRARFSSGVGGRIVGAVPVVDAGAEFPRHHEVIEFLVRSGRAPEFWIGIDDDVRAYPDHCRVVLTDPARGFDDAAARRLAVLARERRG
ncbi:MAG TPA: HAD domain-containing protein [Thermoanaerobaculia bacterium]|nr:HAD domain-containing protein [Thermoanaerobaculia bacterium]